MYEYTCAWLGLQSKHNRHKRNCRKTLSAESVQDVWHYYVCLSGLSRSPGLGPVKKSFRINCFHSLTVCLHFRWVSMKWVSHRKPAEVVSTHTKTLKDYLQTYIWFICKEKKKTLTTNFNPSNHKNHRWNYIFPQTSQPHFDTSNPRLHWKFVLFWELQTEEKLYELCEMLSATNS